MYKLICLFLGYLFGCFQTSYILGKSTRKIDIRQYGSGNAGTTNTIRVLGWKLGVVTFCGDLFKAIIAVLICKYLFQDNSLMAALYAGFGVIVGHNWPFYLHFRGGKGIASTLGFLFAFDYRVGLICLLLIALTIMLTKYVSLGSIILAISLPIVVYFFHSNNPSLLEIMIITTLFTISALFKHRSNIKRLLSGTESKLKIKQKTKEIK